MIHDINTQVYIHSQYNHVLCQSSGFIIFVFVAKNMNNVRVCVCCFQNIMRYIKDNCNSYCKDELYCVIYENRDVDANIWCLYVCRERETVKYYVDENLLLLLLLLLHIFDCLTLFQARQVKLIPVKTLTSSLRYFCIQKYIATYHWKSPSVASTCLAQGTNNCVTNIDK